jgi:hypothetical protein
VGIIPDVFMMAEADISKGGSQESMFRDELASYQLVGRVMAYQGF